MLREGDHVHVAFDHDHPARGADGAARLVQPVDLAPLFEHRCFRRIQVFRFALAQHAPPETYDIAAGIDDREHDAIAEAVVPLAVVAFDDEAGIDQRPFAR